MPERFLIASGHRSGSAYLVLHRGEDVRLRMQLVPPLDVTGWTITLEAVPELGGAVQFSKSASIVDGPRGRFDFTLASADTATLNPGRYSFDVRRTDSGHKTTLADGVFELRQEVTP